MEVHDGPSVGDPSLGKYCGTVRPSSLVSTSNVMLVRFSTDPSVAKTGFQLVYSAKGDVSFNVHFSALTGYLNEGAAVGEGGGGMEEDGLC